MAADLTATEDMKRMNAALLASAEGQWTEASDNLKAILEKDSENYVVCPIFYYMSLYHSVDIDAFRLIGCQQPVCCLVKPRKVEGGEFLKETYAA